MKVRKSAVTLWVLVLLGMVVVSGCGPVTVETPAPTPDIAATVEAAVVAALASQPNPDVAATAEAAIATALASQPAPDVAATAEAAVAAALASQPAPDIAATVKVAVATEIAAAQKTQEPTTVALISYHGRYVIAMGEDGDWLLRQELELGDCGQFTLQHLDCGEVALVTCHGRYVTAPKAGATLSDWALRQEPELGDCGRFTRHDLDHGRVAFETCAGRYVTAADNSWEQELHWLVIAQTYVLDAWETFTMVQQ